MPSTTAALTSQSEMNFRIYPPCFRDLQSCSSWCGKVAQRETRVLQTRLRSVTSQLALAVTGAPFIAGSQTEPGASWCVGSGIHARDDGGCIACSLRVQRQRIGKRSDIAMRPDVPVCACIDSGFRKARWRGGPPTGASGAQGAPVGEPFCRMTRLTGQPRSGGTHSPSARTGQLTGPSRPGSARPQMAMAHHDLA